MTLPSITGSIVQIQSSAANGSQSISVPSDAKLCVVCVAYWGVNGQNYATMTLGGEALAVKVSQTNDVSYGFTTMWTRANPLTGTRTFAWTMSRACDEGANIFIVFLKDVDVSGEPVRASGAGKDATLATSASFASDANDLCLCVGYSYTSTDCNAAPSGAGQTEVADSTAYNNCQGAVGTKPGVAGNTTMKVGGSYCVIVAMSIKGTVSALEVSPGNADMRVDVLPPSVVLGDIEIHGLIADLRVDVLAPSVVIGDIEVWPGNADLRLDALAPGVVLGDIEIHGLIADLCVDVVVVTVEISGSIPPLGQDTPGFVFWMLANSYYENMMMRGYGEGLEEPTGGNAESWGGIFFLP